MTAAAARQVDTSILSGTAEQASLTAAPAATAQRGGPAASAVVAGTKHSVTPAMPINADGALPGLDPITVRCGVMHIHAVLPYVTYRGPHPPHRRHWARVVIDFNPDPQTRLSVDTASLKTLRRWLRRQLLYAENVAACVAEAVANTVGVAVDVTVKQHKFNSVKLTPSGRSQPGVGQEQPSAEANQ